MTEPWLAASAATALLLAADAGVARRLRPVTITTAQAALWVLLWAGLAGAFAVGLALVRSPGVALSFLGVYLAEKALAADNLFVVGLAFTYFAVPTEARDRVLFWAITGMIALRAGFALLADVAVDHLDWLAYPLGAALVWVAVRTLADPHPPADTGSALPVRVARRVLPLSRTYDGARLITRVGGGMVATPLAVVLALLLLADLAFALSMVTAKVLATGNALVVYAANVFAVLGLRPLYLLVGSSLNRLEPLRLGLSLVVGLVGVKLLLVDVYKFTPGLTLALTASALLVGALLSSQRVPGSLPADQTNRSKS